MGTYDFPSQSELTHLSAAMASCGLDDLPLALADAVL
jgi:hypothetical protein